MKILDKDLLPVVGATALASVMILFTGNGVAESVKQTEQQLPPPGPFDVAVDEGKSVIMAPIAGSVSIPSTPKAPVMPSSQAITQHKNEARVAPKLEKAPVFIRVMPSLPQALQAIESPKDKVTKLPVAPKMPVESKHEVSDVKAVSMPVLTAPMPTPANLHSMKIKPPRIGMVAPQYQANIMPKMMPSMSPQQPVAGKMPIFTDIAPKIQKYRYVPIPAYQATQGYPVAPVYRGYPSAPRFQVPHNNRVNTGH